MMPVEHISEELMHRFVFSPDVLSGDEHRKIEMHVRECWICRDLLESMKAFQKSLELNLKEPPTARDRDLAAKILGKSPSLPINALERQASKVVEAYAEVIDSDDRRIVQRTFRLVQTYPVRFAGGFSLAAALVIWAVLSLKPIHDTNPVSFQSKGGVISILNKNGEVLWEKQATGMPNDTMYEFPNGDDGTQHRVCALDIDGDGKNEVLIAGFHSDNFADDTLYCFTSDGTLDWKHGMGHGIEFGMSNFSNSTDWSITRVIAIRRTPQERIQLFVIGQLLPSWPTKLSELDPLTGRELSSYWHPGSLGTAVAVDVNGDGTKELVLGGINNCYNNACVVVFDTRSVAGVGPVTPEFHSTSHVNGTETYYVLIPPTSFSGDLSASPYNSIKQLRYSRNQEMTIQTREIGPRPDSSGGIVYSFGKDMEYRYAIADDWFIKIVSRARTRGLVNGEIDTMFYAGLRKSIRYWDGDKFVSERTRIVPPSKNNSNP
jgi:hypothetical protein